MGECALCCGGRVFFGGRKFKNFILIMLSLSVFCDILMNELRRISRFGFRRKVWVLERNSRVIISKVVFK